tara:strand:- start:2569 stop:2772 length:204 start_codon:yes stop_codon:yes gene_type:complete
MTRHVIRSKEVYVELERLAKEISVLEKQIDDTKRYNMPEVRMELCAELAALYSRLRDLRGDKKERVR